PATGSNRQGITFRLLQPTGGLSSFAEFLITRGEGIHSLCLAVLGEGEFEQLRAGLPDSGVSVGQAATVDGAASHYHLDTRAALGGSTWRSPRPLARRGIPPAQRTGTGASPTRSSGPREWRSSGKCAGSGTSGWRCT